MDNKTIFRINKNKENPYVMLDKRVLENTKLSWKSKGLLAYMLSRPDDWTFNMAHLVKQSTDGEASMRSAMKELIDAKYVQMEKVRKENKQFAAFEYTVYEEPFCENPQMEKPQVEKPQVEKPQVENRNVNNKEYTKTDDNNIQESTAKAVEPEYIYIEEKPKQSTRDPRLDHPAMIALRKVYKNDKGSSVYPKKIQWDEYIKIIGENPDVDRIQWCWDTFVVSKGWYRGAMNWIQYYNKPYNNGFKQPQMSAAERQVMEYVQNGGEL